MGESYLKITLQALAEKIDRLSGEVYIRDLQIEQLKKEKAEAEKHAVELEKENKKLKEAAKLLEKAIVQEDGE